MWSCNSWIGAYNVPLEIWELKESTQQRVLRNFVSGYKFFYPLSTLTAYKIFEIWQIRHYKAGALIWSQNKQSILNFEYDEYYKNEASSIQKEAMKKAIEERQTHLSEFQRILMTYSTSPASKPVYLITISSCEVW